MKNHSKKKNLDGFVFVLPAIEMSIVIASHPATDK
jgi:hypothetical protein